MKTSWQFTAVTVSAALALAGASSWGYWRVQQRLEERLQLQRQSATQRFPVSRQYVEQLVRHQGLQPLNPAQWRSLPGQVASADILVRWLRPGQVTKTDRAGPLQRDELPLELSAWARHEEALAQLMGQLAAMPGLIDVRQCTLSRASSGGIEILCRMTVSAAGVRP